MTPTADLMKLVEKWREDAAEYGKIGCVGLESIKLDCADQLQSALTASCDARVGGEVVDGLRAERDAALEAARAWRSRFVSERMNAYPNDAYEVCRDKAEDSANQFEEAFKAARLPKEKES